MRKIILGLALIFSGVEARAVDVVTSTKNVVITTGLNRGSIIFRSTSPANGNPAFDVQNNAGTSIFKVTQAGTMTGNGASLTGIGGTGGGNTWTGQNEFQGKTYLTGGVYGQTTVAAASMTVNGIAEFNNTVSTGILTYGNCSIAGGAGTDNGSIKLGLNDANYGHLCYDGAGGDLYIKNSYVTGTADIVFHEDGVNVMRITNGNTVNVTGGITATTSLGAATADIGPFDVTATSASVIGSGGLAVTYNITAGSATIATVAASTPLVVYGWSPIGGISTDNGALSLGLNTAYRGRMYYDGSGGGDLYLENTYANAGADIFLRQNGTNVLRVTAGTTVAVTGKITADAPAVAFTSSTFLGVDPAGTPLQLYYCDGGTFAGNIVRGASGICTAGTAVPLSIYVK